MAKKLTRVEHDMIEHCLPCYVEEGHPGVRATVQIKDPEDEEPEWTTYMCSNHAEVLDPETYSPYYPAKDPRRFGNKYNR